MYFILDENNTPKKVDNVLQWAGWFEKNDPHLARDEFEDVFGNIIVVSTVFNGLSANYTNRSKLKLAPYLWETIILGGRHHDMLLRACTHEDALANHQKALRLARMSA